MMPVANFAIKEYISRRVESSRVSLVNRQLLPKRISVLICDFWPQVRRMRNESERVGRPQPGHERARVPQELGGALDRLQFCDGEFEDVMVDDFIG